MLSFFSEQRIKKIFCYHLFGSQNNIQEEDCYNLIIMPYGNTGYRPFWQSIHFGFNHKGRIVTLELVFNQTKNDLSLTENTLQILNENMIALTQKHGMEEKIFKYNTKSRLYALPYLSEDNEAFIKDLLNLIPTLFNIENEFAKKLPELALNQGALAYHHYRLLASSPEAPHHHACCSLM